MLLLSVNWGKNIMHALELFSNKNPDVDWKCYIFYLMAAV